MSQTIALNAARFWRERPQEVILAGAVALAGLVALAGSAGSTPALSGLGSDRVANAPPAPPPMLVRQIPVDQALAINNTIAVDTGPNPAAKPFVLGKADAATRARAVECLTSAIYYEAGQVPTASVRLPRWCSTASATRLSRRMSAASSTKGLRARRAASSPSRAMAR